MSLQAGYKVWESAKLDRGGSHLEGTISFIIIWVTVWRELGLTVKVNLIKVAQRVLLLRCQSLHECVCVWTCVVVLLGCQRSSLTTVCPCRLKRKTKRSRLVCSCPSPPLSARVSPILLSSKSIQICSHSPVIFPECLVFLVIFNALIYPLFYCNSIQFLNLVQ